MLQAAVADLCFLWHANGSPYKYSTFKSQEGIGSSDEAAVCVYDY